MQRALPTVKHQPCLMLCSNQLTNNMPHFNLCPTVVEMFNSHESCSCLNE